MMSLPKQIPPFRMEEGQVRYEINRPLFTEEDYWRFEDAISRPHKRFVLTPEQRLAIEDAASGLCYGLLWKTKFPKRSDLLKELEGVENRAAEVLSNPTEQGVRELISWLDNRSYAAHVALGLPYRDDKIWHGAPDRVAMDIYQKVRQARERTERDTARATSFGHHSGFIRLLVDAVNLGEEKQRLRVAASQNAQGPSGPLIRLLRAIDEALREHPDVRRHGLVPSVDMDALYKRIQEAKRKSSG
ncbi:hypothetical protein [Rhodoligotrophos defluvii]|uniref:hypothetical protein n=1 Tax=Rhodoligotrophos defluvii TaxID=2561934 RepID=UPI0010C98F95|nr:hypothetical protein [Rhodoligotrophos defluvii]